VRCCVPRRRERPRELATRAASECAEEAPWQAAAVTRYRTLGVIMPRRAKPEIGDDGEVDLATRLMEFAARPASSPPVGHVGACAAPGSHENSPWRTRWVPRERANLKFMRHAASGVIKECHSTCVRRLACFSLGLSLRCAWALRARRSRRLVCLEREEEAGGARRHQASGEMVQVKGGANACVVFLAGRASA